MRLPESLERFRPYEHRIIATVIAFVLAVLLLTIGFWKTLLLALVTVIGFAIGSYQDGTGQTMFARLAALFSRR